ncbi:MAG: MFS transporter, partial [Chloroflexia bacterium]|nr:MFS transporter [Chloroflexia bacterium]
LVFVPLLVWVVDGSGWRAASWLLAGCALALLIPVLIFMRDDPAAVGLEPYGGALPTLDMGPAVPSASPAASPPTGPGPLRLAMVTGDFWLLAGSFFICGATSTGLIGTHFIAHSTDHGFAASTAAGTLAVMGAMNFVGTVTSGWLTDRYDPRRLLACYYTFRGVSLFFLPAVTGFWGLAAFAVLFGLDYIATVPPTAALTADRFGRHNVAAIFGWIFFAHQLGAAAAAYLGGVLREAVGDYQVAFLAAGALAVVGALMALRISPSPGDTPRFVGAPA